MAKISAKTRDTFPDFEKPQFSPEKYGPSVQYKTLPRDFIDPAKYHVQYSPHMGKKLPPSPPKRQLDSCNENQEQTTVEIHQTSSPLPLPAYPSSDSLSITLDGGGDLPLPPPPAPATPPQARMNPSRSWGSSEEQELINALALQHRNGSDASFKVSVGLAFKFLNHKHCTVQVLSGGVSSYSFAKPVLLLLQSSSSTESDSLPFANENAGTIKTRTGGRPAEYPPMKSRPGMPPHPSPTPVRTNSQSQQQQQQRSQRAEPADVLNDIGNMLANLTDELDAMLEEEKRQGLEPTQ